MNDADQAAFEVSIEDILLDASDAKTGRLSTNGLTSLSALLSELGPNEYNHALLYIGKMMKGELREAKGVLDSANARASLHQSRARDLFEFLHAHMPDNVSSLVSEHATLRWKKSRTVEVVDKALVPRSLLRTVPETVEVDKLTARTLLLTGQEIPGLHLKVEDKLEVE